MERRMFRKHIDASRLFVYKLARQLDGFKGDTGAYIRTAMKALRLFGAPPERHWPYDIGKFDEDPPAMAFAYGQSLQALQYYRLDCRGQDRQTCLGLLKQLVASGYPVAFGFLVYSFGNKDGEFPMPDKDDRYYGGHAVMAVGYDDAREIGKSTGAILIRNSWGTDWGQDGYGWLPYDYVLTGLSWDFWMLRRKESVRG
jgi:C1A family cysteine protease